ncbi:hypothetical protein EV421DRAFT_1972189 [Armillaria borealis]|uniref:Uncharacterized protein n=1 Tax=Armillaria borealis TaxID=47425 RepID=A0AA39MLY7_9AGAR|nr:hypothetical protein EV421DRAFT_1972189 [Armillaria borealis]
MDSSPLLIGSGSFGSVYIVLASLVAFKEVQLDSNAAQLQAELRPLNKSTKLAVPTCFFSASPTCVQRCSEFRALAYHSPRTGGLRPLVASASFAAFKRPVYAMDRVQALSTEVAARIRSQFYPAGAPAKGPFLFRLYFGKDYTESRPSRFINTSHFFLDVTRYRQLASSKKALLMSFQAPKLLPKPWDTCLDAFTPVEATMGVILSLYSAGMGFSGFTFYVIDFNQVCTSIFGPLTRINTWLQDAEMDTVDELVDAHIANDPYFL